MARIRDCFTGVGVKVMRSVDTPEGSNQSEIGGARIFQPFLGDVSRKVKDGNGYPTSFIRLTDDETETVKVDDLVSWYDTRAGNPKRSPEWRLCYKSSSPVMRLAREGDVCVIAKRPDGSLLIIISPGGSSVSMKLMAMFSPRGTSNDGSIFLGSTENGIDWETRRVLESIGIEPPVEETGNLQQMLKIFGMKLPGTSEFSAYARTIADEVSPKDDPDGALVCWFECEDRLFREFEAEIIRRDLEKGGMLGSSADVEALSKYFLSTHNRRKSRAGHAFMSHVREVMLMNDLQHEREVMTEHGKKIDFMFPSGGCYADQKFPVSRLTALGAKTSCKDRWRQVLSEADRVPNKYLITMESNISSQQLKEMRSKDLRLVIPKSRHWDFRSGNVSADPMSVMDFIVEVRRRNDARATIG